MKVIECHDGSVSVTVESAPLAPLPVQVERDELLAALKRLVEESALVEVLLELEPGEQLTKARALIARIEGGQ